MRPAYSQGADDAQAGDHHPARRLVHGVDHGIKPTGRKLPGRQSKAKKTLINVVRPHLEAKGD